MDASSRAVRSQSSPQAAAFEREILTEIAIDAPPERVWAVLTDFAAYPDWNPFLRSISGELVAGARIDVRMTPGAGRAYRFRPRLQAVVAGRELRWLGRAGVRGLFDGEHAFTLVPLAGGRTLLRQHERFSGLLVPLVGGMLARTRRAFDAMNLALKERAEHPACQPVLPSARADRG
jgi:hypothetical protein